mgnify:FL=1
MKEKRIIKKVTFKGPVKDAPDDYKYSINRSTDERISAVEILREQFYGKTTPRLQRVYKIIKQKSG